MCPNGEGSPEPFSNGSTHLDRQAANCVAAQLLYLDHTPEICQEQLNGYAAEAEAVCQYRELKAAESSRGVPRWRAILWATGAALAAGLLGYAAGAAP